MSHSDIAHNFAHYTGNKKNGYNVFYEENENGSATIYSYGHHFGIAHRLQKDTYGLNICLFTLSDYSVSTSKHISIVSSALSHYNKIYVPEPVQNYINIDGKIEIGPHRIESDLKYFSDKLQEAIKKHIRAIKYSYENEIVEAVKNAKKYADFFNCKNKLTGKLREIIHGQNELTEADILTACLSDSEIEKVKEREAAKKQREAEKRKEAVKRFRDGKISHIHSLNNTLLRLKDDKIQTSKGVTIKDTEALILWRKMREAADTGKSINYIKGRFAGYSIDKITPKALKAGCHIVKYSEAEMIASKKGWL